MPKFLEEKLKKRYGKKSKIPYMIMNKMGVMRGNKETAKGERMEEKHEQHMSSPVKGLSSHKMPKRKRKKKAEAYDPFARAMNK